MFLHDLTNYNVFSKYTTYYLSLMFKWTNKYNQNPLVLIKVNNKATKARIKSQLLQTPRFRLIRISLT